MRFSGPRGHNAGQQLLSSLRCLGHLIVERERRVIGKAEQLCALRPKLRQTRDDRFRVVLAAVITTAH